MGMLSPQRSRTDAGYWSMIVEYSTGGGLRLTEPDNFRNFKLLMKGDCDREALAREGINLIDDRHALIAINLVPTLPGRPDSESWQTGYVTMIEAARQYGWIDAQAKAIRAHVEREI